MHTNWKLFFSLFLKTFITFNGNDLKYIVDNVENTISDYIYQQDLNGIIVEDEEISEIRRVAKDAMYMMYEQDFTEPNETEIDDSDEEVSEDNGIGESGDED